MTDISIQFHATPTEIAQFVSEFTDDFELSVTCVKLMPFEARSISRQQIESTLSDERCWRLAFTQSEPVVDAINLDMFEERNPGNLMLEIGRKTHQGLKQSWLCCRVFDRKQLNAWRKIAKQLNAITQSGAYAVNPTTGAKARFTKYRYTEGARELQLKGIKMLAFAGNSQIIFGE